MEDATVATQGRIKSIIAAAAIVGGGSIINVLCGIVRGKVISMTLGPAGVGLSGLLQSTLRTSSSLTGAVLQTNGVREVARLRGQNDDEELGYTLRALRLATIGFAALGALLLVVFRRPLAGALLDDPELGSTLAVLGLGVSAQILYGAYDAFLRGFRRIALLTKASVLANIVATAAGSSLVFVVGEDAIVWAVIAQPIVVLGAAAIAGRDFSKHVRGQDRRRTRESFNRLIRAGLVLAAAGLISAGVQLLARVLVAHSTTLDDVGYFQAAWSVSVLYLGFVLGTMSLDYYPRLAEAGADPSTLSRMVNEQAKVSFLLAGPSILALLTLSSQIISLLYTPTFAPAAEILRWQLLGDVLKIGSWTLGYLFMATGSMRVYFVTEMAWNVVYLAVLAVLLPSLGVTATAYAYIAAGGVYFLVQCIAAHRVVGFSWSASNLTLIALVSILAAAALVAHHMLSTGWAFAAGALITVSFGSYCLYRIIHETGFIAQLRRKHSR